jgi:hypothetical protein
MPIPGSSGYEFNDCPAYYLRTAGMGLPADHLVDGVIHPAQPVSEWAFEVESGARNVDTLSAKAASLVHLYIAEKRARDEYEREMKRGKHAR